MSSLLHISLPTGPKAFEAMRNFYVATLRPLGYTTYVEQSPVFCGLKGGNGPDFWLHVGNKDLPKIDSEHTEMHGGGVHVAFSAASKEIVDEWYKIAL